MQETHQMASRSLQSIFCQEGISRRLVTVLRMVAVQCATWRETVGEQRSHCSPAASRTFHIPGLLLHLHHPCTLTGSFQEVRGYRSLEINGAFQILPDEDLAMGFRKALVWQSHERWKMYLEGTKPWTNTKFFLTVQNWPAQLPEPQTAPSQTILQCQRWRSTMIWLIAVLGWFWTGPSFKREHRLGITHNSLSLGTIPLSTP